MFEYTLRRILWVIPVIIAVATVTFILMNRAPGGPWDREKTLPLATIKALDAKFGLDKPLWINPDAVSQAAAAGERKTLALKRAHLDSRDFKYKYGVARYYRGPT